MNRHVDRLGGEDAAWLHMEDATNPMVVSGVLELGGNLSVAAVARRLEERLVSNPRFRARIVESRLGVPHWEPDDGFDLQRQVEHVALSEGEDVRVFIGKAVSELLDRERPLWRVYVIDRPNAGTTLLFRVHHAIADGFALLAVLLSLCDEEQSPTIAIPSENAAAGKPLAYVSSALRLLTLSSDPKTALKGPLGRRKGVAWTAPFSLDEVKDAAHRMNATVNDVLVSVIAGALRRVLAKGGETPENLRAMVPVSLRLDVRSLERGGNHFGLVVLDLPIGIADSRARVWAVKKSMNKLKAAREAIVAHVILRALGWAPRFVEDLGVAFFARTASLVLTNVPGPKEKLHFAKVPVDRVLFWVPQSGRMGLGISIFSYAGKVTIGVMADVGLLDDPELLAREVEEELAAVLADS